MKYRRWGPNKFQVFKISIWVGPGTSSEEETITL